ncbi:MAG: hypothetical protein KDM81_20050, partial [Verrucomicrobiae bacterium]|nr:hypothetical protein [Verrucomicrobiae bacterium]
GIWISSSAIYDDPCSDLTGCPEPGPLRRYYLKAVWNRSVVVNLEDHPTMSMHGTLEKTKTWTYDFSGTPAEEWTGNVSYDLTNSDPCEDHLDPGGGWHDGRDFCEDSVLGWLDADLVSQPCTPTTALVVRESVTDYNGGTLTQSDVQTCLLSDEFTDEALRDHIVAITPGFPSEWSAGGLGNACASFELDAAHELGEGQRLHYRFRVDHTAKDVDYVLRYHLLTMLATGQGVEWSERQPVSIPFTGTGQSIYLDAGILEPPVWSGTLPTDGGGNPLAYRMQVFVDVSEMEVLRVDGGAGGDAGAPGNGSVGGGGDSAGCTTCGGGFPERSSTRPGVDLVIPMGARSHGGSAGFFQLLESEAGDDLADPASLTYSFPSGIPGQVEVLRDPVSGT